MQDRAVAFCDWLQGFFEITAAGVSEDRKRPLQLKDSQVKLIRDKLDEVYPAPATTKAQEA